MSLVILLGASLELLSATFLTLTLPLRISLVVAKIDCQLSKVVNGIPSRSQKVTRSRICQSHASPSMNYIIKSNKNVPFPARAKRRSVSEAAQRSEIPSPAYNRVGRMLSGN